MKSKQIYSISFFLLIKTVMASYLDNAQDAAAKLQSYWYDHSSGLWYVHDH